MWAFTVDGFFSAVAANDLGDVAIRARRRGHLLNLKGRFRLRHAVLEWGEADYPYRIIVSHELWVRIATALAADVSKYGNFKGEVARTKRRTGAPYERALHEVWAVMRRTED